ncbi:unannotated protein [freshwater metagenome]|uniref:Unannotated protein n=1 Tax=freshwater metagenome TaxID=449393 RepID=A0A6J7EF17_9ZZZZ
MVHLYLEHGGTASAAYAQEDVTALEELLAAQAAPLLDGAFPVAAEPHVGICGACPGRRGLCSWPEELTLRPAFEQA